MLLNIKKNVHKSANFKVGDIVYLSNGHIYRIIAVSNNCFTLKNHNLLVKVQGTHLFTKEQYEDFKRESIINKANKALDYLNGL